MILKFRAWLMRILSGSEITFVSNVIITGDIKPLGTKCYLMNNRLRGKVLNREDEILTVKDINR